MTRAGEPKIGPYPLRGGTRTVTRLTVIALGLAFISCSRDQTPEVGSEAGIPTSQIVDEPSAPSITIDDFETLWRSDALGRPNVLALHEGTLFVGDRDRLHLVREDGTYLTTVGQSGQGPEEFGSIAAIHAGPNGVVVLDSRNVRFSFLTLEGRFQRTGRIDWPVPYVNPARRGDPVGTALQGMVRIASENVRLNRATRVALVWHGFDSDTTRILKEWNDTRWVDTGLIATERLFGPRAIVGVSPDGGFVYGDGLEYCYTVDHAAASRPQRFCRERPRIPTGSGIRTATVDGFPELGDLDPDARASLDRSMRSQEVDDYFPSYDRLMLADDSTVWVRTIVDPPDVHPALLARLPHLQPTHDTWESVGPQGRARITLQLPRSFTPKEFQSGVAYGFGELASGELVVARVQWE